MEIEAIKDTSLSETLGTKIPKWLEKEIKLIVEKDRRTVSSFISFLLEEYYPIKKFMRINREQLFPVQLDETTIIKFSHRDGEEISEFLKIQITENDFVLNKFSLNQDQALKIAANLITYLIDQNKNG